MHSTLKTLILLSTPIHAATTARVWTHFYPSCPGEPFSDLATYENYEETAPSKDISAGQCMQIGVPSYEHNLVSALSVDAEFLSKEKGHPFPPSNNPNCNITVHEVPGCIDDPLITHELHNGVEVSECHERNFAAYSDIWVQLVCEGVEKESLSEQQEDIPRIDETASVQNSENVQTPGSNENSWHLAQTQSSERQPEEESRVNDAGHLESEEIVHRVMEALHHKAKGMHLVSGKHNATRYNGTAPKNATLSRRKLSVLRNRVARLNY
ncbi:hypothetical protein N7478_000476 [Penicillium angulare]|uniref:uncharacterized protein n=1 Tax=Penicillium angulare TaxID=116970 RepID=UPI00253FBF71|nr:uncharacterized protein N7478_000476 [Penicillium angulare]KAJ5291225.1 hypothetical protein N7478_000476 [Penicillium angulare]